MDAIRFRLSKIFYTIDAVKKSAEDYKEFCSCHLKEEDNHIIILMTPKPGVPLSVKEEFCNYVLGLKKNM